MKKFIIPALLAVVAVVSGCKFEDALLYGEATMGRVSNGNIITDTGLTYVVSESECTGDFKSCDRIYILCDVLKKLEAENTYSVRLNGYAEVSVNETVRKSDQSEEWFGDDAVNLENGWFSGGYLNVYVKYSAVQGSDTKHRFSLMFDDTADNSDTLHFYLKHNGFGETYEKDPDNTKMTMDASYISFPVDSFLPAGSKGMNVKVEWDWYKIQNNQYLSETEHYGQTVYYAVSDTRSDF